MTRLSVALVQLDAGSDSEANVAAAAELADEAAAGGARLVALPEYLQYRGDDDGFRESARAIPGPFTAAFSEIYSVSSLDGAGNLVGSMRDKATPAASRTTSTVAETSPWTTKRSIT